MVLSSAADPLGSVTSALTGSGAVNKKLRIWIWPILQTTMGIMSKIENHEFNIQIFLPFCHQ
jgi:hypothetical protein